MFRAMHFQACIVGNNYSKKICEPQGYCSRRFVSMRQWGINIDIIQNVLFTDGWSIIHCAVSFGFVTIVICKKTIFQTTATRMDHCINVAYCVLDCFSGLNALKQISLLKSPQPYSNLISLLRWRGNALYIGRLIANVWRNQSSLADIGLRGFLTTRKEYILEYHFNVK